MQSTTIWNGVPRCGSWRRATSASTSVGTIRPVIADPSTNGPSNLTPNQVPKDLASLMACQTRSREDLRTVDFRIWSEFTTDLHEPLEVAFVALSISGRRKHKATHVARIPESVCCSTA